MSSVKKINCVVLVNDPVEIEILQMALDDIAVPVNCMFFTGWQEVSRVFNTAQFLPDCIIIDSDLGDIGRKDYLQRIKNIPFVSKVPVVIFAGLLSDLEMTKLKELGAYGFISKANSTAELKNNLLGFFNSNFDLKGDLGI